QGRIHRLRHGARSAPRIRLHPGIDADDMRRLGKDCTRRSLIADFTVEDDVGRVQTRARRPGSAAARPRVIAGSTSQSIATRSAASFAAVTLSATTTATISPTWHTSGKIIG